MTSPDLCVCVTTEAGDQPHPTATDWTVDARLLTLTGPDGVVASYAPGSWNSVTRKPTPA